MCVAVLKPNPLCTRLEVEAVEDVEIVLLCAFICVVLWFLMEEEGRDGGDLVSFSTSGRTRDLKSGCSCRVPR